MMQLQATVRAMNHGRFVSAACALVCSAVILGSANSADQMPAARQLVTEALAACGAGEEREKHYWALSSIANAYVYLGDAAGARSTLLPYKDDLWIRISYLGCAGLEIELTGMETVLPPPVWKDDPDTAHWSLAEAYAKRGDVAKALEHLNQVPATRLSMLHGLGHSLVAILEAGGHRDATRQVLLKWADSFADAESCFDFTRPRTERLVALLGEYGEANMAKELCTRWKAILQNETDVAENGEFIGLAWAQLGRSMTILGDRSAAREALEKSWQWLEAARAASFDPNRRDHYLDYAFNYASLAVRQAGVLEPDVVAGTYERAYDMAAKAIPTIYDYFGFEKIVEAQLQADDDRAALQTINKILSRKYRSHCWKRIIDYFVKQGRGTDARRLLNSVADELARGDSEPSIAQEIADIAALAARTGEPELAQRLFKRAIALSESERSDPKVHHGWIAKMQIHGGLLSDAYKTIQAIPDKDDRIQPLAELACEVAKTEYLAAKNR
jgi:tetratricopeptide (TPR) repeat protein